MSCPRLSTSACRLRLLACSTYCDAEGWGGGGGGPVAVIGRILAYLEGDVWNFKREKNVGIVWQGLEETYLKGEWRVRHLMSQDDGKKRL